jgi:SWI/SNF-related matrix-associated actin-dependent regulator of chromatin subfamily A3
LLLPHTGGGFGCLEERAAEILSTLAGESRISLQLYAYMAKRRQTRPMKGKKIGQNDVQYLVNAILYGPKEFCKGVGNYLEKCKMFLQDPLQCDRDVPYHNPHLLSRTQEVVMTSSFFEDTTQPPTLEVVTLEAPKDLFSQLSDDEHLQLTETPSILCRPLYK